MKKIKPTVLTSYFILVPLATALYFQIYIYAVLISLSFMSSLKYHGSSEKEWAPADNAFATLVFLYNLYLCFLFRYELKLIIPITLITALAFLIFFIQKRDYEFYHSLWHILVIAGTFLCALGFGLL
jgi:mannose/fructose/N-acetylgalactosamine-specific phosphotransferase system component IIC